MKRAAIPVLSRSGESALRQYEQVLCEQEDLTPASVRNDLSDVRQFMAWYEAQAEAAQRPDPTFTSQSIATPTLTRYQTHLQTVQRHKPASVNRPLISLKRYFGWAKQNKVIMYDPSRAVKWVGQEVSSPRHLDDDEEQALVATVTEQGTLRDRVLIVLLLHTGLRAREVCCLRRDQVKRGLRSGWLEIIGKRNKYREVPLNATARKVLEVYLPTLPLDIVFLFPSGKTKGALSERALGYIVKKYARIAKLPDVSPHDLRHRFGYRMAESVPLHRLAQIMGHESLDTTTLSLQGTKHDLPTGCAMSARGTDPPACHLGDTTRASNLLVREITRRLPALAALLNDLLAKVNTFAANEDPRAGNQPLDLVLLLATERAARH